MIQQADIHQAKDTELQEQLVGCCLLQGGKDVLAGLIEHGLTPQWFTDPRCQHTFDAVHRMYSRSDPMIELTTVWHELGGAEMPFDSKWLDECVDKVPSKQMATYFSRSTS